MKGNFILLYYQIAIFKMTETKQKKQAIYLFVKTKI